MSDDEPVFTSLKDRIAALNLQNNSPVPSPPAPKPKPKPTPAPPAEPKAPAPPPARTAASNSAVKDPTKRAGWQPPVVPHHKTRDVGAAWAAKAEAPPAPARDTPGDAHRPPLPAGRRPSVPVRKPSVDAAVRGEEHTPSLNPRRPSVPIRKQSEDEQSPALPSRRPSVPARKSSTAEAAPPKRTIPPAPSGGAVRPPVPNTRRPSHAASVASEDTPPLPVRRPSHTASVKSAASEDDAPPLPARVPPPLPGTARPPLPGTARPLLPTRKSTAEPEVEEPKPVAARNRFMAPTVKCSGPPPPLSLPTPEPVIVNSNGTSNGGPPPIPGGRPPPVPKASRPKAAPVAAAPAVTHAPNSIPPGHTNEGCLICRDFTQPDLLASQYPMSDVPSHDPIGFLAEHICAPFQSATDKARAIFTWCHHNIAYDAANFFAKTIPRGLTAEDTMRSGMAVCNGYADVFSALAERAGLECGKVTGNGKGFGFTPPAPGTPLPAEDTTGHAWNAVCIDDGEWKLVDACWGAGYIDNASRQFVKRFAPQMFVMSNDDFGARHYPADPGWWLRSDGGALGWAQYLLGRTQGSDVPAIWYGTADAEELSPETYEPPGKHVAAGQDVRFLVGRNCPHSDGAARGGAWPMQLSILHTDGERELRTLESDGFWFWIDVPGRDLESGAEVSLIAIDKINGGSSRGVSVQEWEGMKGRVGYSLMGLVAWEVV